LPLIDLGSLCKVSACFSGSNFSLALVTQHVPHRDGNGPNLDHVQTGVCIVEQGQKGFHSILFRPEDDAID
jgi:hypothetical protein